MCNSSRDHEPSASGPTHAGAGKAPDARQWDMDTDHPEPHAFLQWKNTDVCFDFYCDCGAHCHFDGYFAYAVRCVHCGSVYEMPTYVFPRKVEETQHSVKDMEPDEDLELETEASEPTPYGADWRAANIPGDAAKWREFAAYISTITYEDLPAAIEGLQELVVAQPSSAEQTERPGPG